MPALGRRPSRDPLSIEPLYLLVQLYQAADDSARRAPELVKATQLQPENPQSWLLAGAARLHHRASPARDRAMQQVLALNLPVDPTPATRSAVIIQATAQLAQPGRRASSRKRSAGLEQRVGQRTGRAAS